MMDMLHYNVVYRNGSKVPVEIADFYRTDDGKFVFEYVGDPQYEFPGFGKSERRFESDHLWEQISFRVPNYVRNQFPDSPPEELLQKTGGRLVTDHFEFQFAGS